MPHSIPFTGPVHGFTANPALLHRLASELVSLLTHHPFTTRDLGDITLQIVALDVLCRRLSGVVHRKTGEFIPRGHYITPRPTRQGRRNRAGQ